MKRGRKTAADRLPPPAPDRRQEWQIAQGKECACGGADDMCRCQNEPKPWVSEMETLRARVVELEHQLNLAAPSGGREELEPCPFCGGRGIGASIDDEGHATHGANFIVCDGGSHTDCEAKTAYYFGPDAQQRARAAWNRRALIPSAQPAGPAEDFHSGMSGEVFRPCPRCNKHHWCRDV